jgi:hypothetical protein
MNMSSSSFASSSSLFLFNLVKQISLTTRNNVFDHEPGHEPRAPRRLLAQIKRLILRIRWEKYLQDAGGVVLDHLVFQPRTPGTRKLDPET